jgi:hypothetical protein
VGKTVTSSRVASASGEHHPMQQSFPIPSQPPAHLGQRCNVGVAAWVEEEGRRVAAAAPRRAHAVQRSFEAIVGEHLAEVAHVDGESAWDGCHQLPAAVGRPHLQPRHVVLHQDGEEPGI